MYFVVGIKARCWPLLRIIFNSTMLVHSFGDTFPGSRNYAMWECINVKRKKNKNELPV